MKHTARASCPTALIALLLCIACSCLSTLASDNPATSPASRPDWTLEPATRPVIEREIPPEPLRFAGGGGFLVGPIDGYVQTPSGGTPGSTSHQRPRLSELGINHASVGQFQISALWGSQEVFGGGEIIRVSATEVLRDDLITHGVSFPAGTVVSSDVGLDWYRIGYRYRFDLLPTSSGATQLMLAPYADAVIWDFDYSIEGGGRRTSRSYIKPTAQLGLIANWRPGAGPFALVADLSSSPPGISSVPFIAVEQISGQYRIAHTATFDISASVGARFEQMNYFDHQRIPNHIRANLGPMLLIGFGIGF